MTDELKRGKKVFVGKVISAKTAQTIVVMVQTQRQNQRYGKYVQRRRKYMAHNDSLECGVGDFVLIEECRPVSKRKRFLAKEIVKKSEEAKK
jgi:small subunit ribosomal protein S17